MTSKLPLEILDGKDTIGGTKILVHENRRGLLLDFGLNFALYGQFFEEYMKPRPVVGLADLWQMRLIPPYLDLYRPELVQCAFSDARKLPVDVVDGIVISHAHLDHFGLVGTIKLDVPVISSAVTLALLRAHQDSGRTEFYSDAAYGSPYQKDTCRIHQILKTGDYRTCPHEGRNAFVMHGALSAELKNLWQRKANPDGSGRNMASGNIGTVDEITERWKIRAYPVDHSIPGACAVTIETENSVIAYTGDLRFCGTKAAESKQFVKEAGKLDVDVLITEGTQVARQNQCKTNEEECREKCEDVIPRAKTKLVIADFSAKNIERLIMFLNVGLSCGRRLVILPKDACLLNYLRQIEPSTPEPCDSLLVYDTPKGKEDKWEEWIYNAYSNHLVSAADIAGAPGEYILAFSLFDMKYLNDIKPKGGTYIHSSSEPYDEEQIIDFKRLYNWLSFYRLDIRGFKIKKTEDEDIQVEMENGFHSSGHMTIDEIKEMVDEIKPKTILPVHTSNPKWFKDEFSEHCEVVL
jgi:ribonuclease J